MFSKEERKAFNKLFWTSFGKYMRPYESETGLNVNWTNYKTRVKDFYVRMDVDHLKAIFSIEIQSADDGVREVFYEQFLELKKVFESEMGHSLVWEPLHFDKYNVPKVRIYTELIGVSKYNKDDWSNIFSFFKEHILGFDRFWAEFSELFVILSD